MSGVRVHLLLSARHFHRLPESICINRRLHIPEVAARPIVTASNRSGRVAVSCSHGSCRCVSPVAAAAADRAPGAASSSRCSTGERRGSAVLRLGDKNGICPAFPPVCTSLELLIDGWSVHSGCGTNKLMAKGPLELPNPLSINTVIYKERRCWCTLKDRGTRYNKESNGISFLTMQM